MPTLTLLLVTLLAITLSSCRKPVVEVPEPEGVAEAPSIGPKHRGEGTGGGTGGGSKDSSGGGKGAQQARAEAEAEGRTTGESKEQGGGGGGQSGGGGGTGPGAAWRKAAKDNYLYASVDIQPTDGNKLHGKAEFLFELDGTIIMNLVLFDAPPGDHAIHIHENGDCGAPDGSSAGPHWNPGGHAHGSRDGEHHAGDLGNLTVIPTGKSWHTVVTNEYNMKRGDDPFSVIGKSIIIHAGADDFTSQPSGNAGSRIACGVIVPKENN